MAHAFMVFRFQNEEQAQQAWHKLEGWKQAFRLTHKLAAKFDRGEAEGEGEEGAAGDGEGATRVAEKGHKTSEQKEGSHKGHKETDHKKGEHAAKSHKGKEDGAGGVRLLVKLKFSDHEKLSFQRWLERIPGEEPFKSAEAEIHKADDAHAAKTEELFDSLR
jgi:hypothetical protein